MMKHCSAVGCHNVYKKKSGVEFYPGGKSKWIVAENWLPSEYAGICSQYFVSGEKSTNSLAPNCVLTLFDYIGSPVKRKLESNMGKFHRRQAMKNRLVVPACSSRTSTTRV